MISRTKVLHLLSKVARAVKDKMDPPPPPPVKVTDPYEQEITRLSQFHREVKQQVSGIVYARNKTLTDLEEKQTALRQVSHELERITREGEEAVDLVMVRDFRERAAELRQDIADLEADLEPLSEIAEEVKRGLLSIQRSMNRIRAAKQKAERRQVLVNSKKVLVRLRNEGWLPDDDPDAA